MKLQSSLKAINKLRTSYEKEMDVLIENLQKSYYVDLVKYQEELLLKIATEYELSYDEMHDKYIKNFKKSLKKSTKKNQLIDETTDSDSVDINNTINDLEEINNVLEKTNIEGKVCFIEHKEGGSIYNKDVIKIGEVKDGEYILYE